MSEDYPLINPGDPLKADWLNMGVEMVRRTPIGPSADIIPQYSPRGVTLHLARRRNGSDDPVALRAEVVDKLAVKVRPGSIFCGNVRIDFAGSEPIDVEDGLTAFKVWLELDSVTAPTTVTVQSGEDGWAGYPADPRAPFVSRFLLAEFDSDSTAIVASRYYWAGGDLIWPAPASLPSFFVRAAGEYQVTISGGTLIHVFNNFALLIPESAPLTVADGDAVWLERTGANTWAFNNGPDTPTDKLNILLAVCTVDEDGIVTLNFDGGWHGGDIIVPEIFPVDLTNDGGAAGDAVSTCNLTYAAEAGGVTIEAGMSPVADRMPNVEYTIATVGICRIKPDGNFELIAALDEIPVPVSVLLAVVTAKDGDCYTIEPHAAMVLSVDPEVTEP